MLIQVTRTMDGEEGSEGMFYKEEKVLEACHIMGCEEEQIESCLYNMRMETANCMDCYITLCLDLKEGPVYESELQEVSR